MFYFSVNNNYIDSIVLNLIGLSIDVYEGGSLLHKKLDIIFTVIIIGVFSLGAEAVFTHSARVQTVPQSLMVCDFKSEVMITVNTLGVAYGHELLWKANTTVTNYEESAVTYANDIAYIGSCSTHGNGIRYPLAEKPLTSKSTNKTC